MASGRTGPLRIPVKIADCYVKPGDELVLFPNCPSYLTRVEAFDAWPGGIITHESFTYRGVIWRLHSGRPGGPASPLQWLAVFDGEAQHPMPHNHNPTGRRSISMSPSDGVTGNQRSPISPCSRPLVDLDVDSSPHAMLPVVRTLASSASPAASASAGNWLSQQAATHARHSGLALAVAQSQSQNKFIEDLLVAESSPNAMDRYKALIRLMSALKRRIAQARINQPHQGQSWESQEHQDIIKQIVMVGECLARFGTAEFSERSNSSRAINTKDYATLLTQFLEAHGTIFAMEFIQHLPQALQDEVLTVRSLLQTRCEANSVIFGQLVKHVGMEGQGNGQAVVYNTSVVTANPTSFASAAPQTLVQVAAKAWAKATEKKSNRYGMIGAAAFLGLLILKRKLFGGGRRGGRGRYESGDTEYEHLSRRRRGNSAMGGALGLAERLLETRTLAERTAVSHMVACNEELQKAQQNIELLTHDWRMGQMRVGGGMHPPGFQPVNLQRCSLGGYLNHLDDPYWQPTVQHYVPRPHSSALLLPAPVPAPPVQLEVLGSTTADSLGGQQEASKRQQKQDRKRAAAKAVSISEVSSSSHAGQVAPGGGPFDAALAVIPAITDMFKL